MTALLSDIFKQLGQLGFDVRQGGEEAGGKEVLDAALAAVLRQGLRSQAQHALFVNRRGACVSQLTPLMLST